MMRRVCASGRGRLSVNRCASCLHMEHEHFVSSAAATKTESIRSPPRHPRKRMFATHPRNGNYFVRTTSGHSENEAISRRRYRLVAATILAGGAVSYGLSSSRSGGVEEELNSHQSNVETELFQTLQKGLYQLNDIVDRIHRGEHVPDSEIDKKVEETLKLIDESHAEIDREIEADNRLNEYDDGSCDGNEKEEEDEEDYDAYEFDENDSMAVTEQMQLIDQLLRELVNDSDSDDDGLADDRTSSNRDEKPSRRIP